MQPDTLIPGVESPQSWNRFSYVNNNPIIHNDPSGHCFWDGCIAEAMIVGALAGGLINSAAYIYNESKHGGFNMQDDWTDLATAAVAGAASGALIANPITATVGISMAIGAIGDHVGNYIRGDDFSAKEHFTTVGMNAIVGGYAAVYTAIFETAWAGVWAAGMITLNHELKKGIYAGLDPTDAAYEALIQTSFEVLGQGVSMSGVGGDLVSEALGDTLSNGLSLYEDIAKSNNSTHNQIIKPDSNKTYLQMKSEKLEYLLP